MSKRMDTYETIAQTLAGVLIGFAINLGVLPLIGIPMDVSKATGVTAIYVVASFVRSYGLRRLFRWIEARPPKAPKPCQCEFCGTYFTTLQARADHEWRCDYRDNNGWDRNGSKPWTRP